MLKSGLLIDVSSEYNVSASIGMLISRNCWVAANITCKVSMRYKNDDQTNELNVKCFIT
jgi:hypothetical protein